MLPGTGGLTRITDKRKLRRDRCDVFSTVAEGIKGKRALEWGLVDALAPLSQWDEKVAEMARRMADELPDRASDGIQLEKIERTGDEDNWAYQYVSCAINSASHTAELTITAPETCPTDAGAARAEPRSAAGRCGLTGRAPRGGVS